MKQLKGTRVGTIARTKDTLELVVPADLSKKEVNVLFETIVSKIEELTGHPCLSGTHDILLRSRFEEIAQVRFG